MNNGINYQLHLLQDFWTINSRSDTTNIRFWNPCLQASQHTHDSVHSITTLQEGLETRTYRNTIQVKNDVKLFQSVMNHMILNSSHFEGNLHSKPLFLSGSLVWILRQIPTKYTTLAILKRGKGWKLTLHKTNLSPHKIGRANPTPNPSFFVNSLLNIDPCKSRRPLKKNNQKKWKWLWILQK